jgi:hypothetical protein
MKKIEASKTKKFLMSVGFFGINIAVTYAGDDLPAAGSNKNAVGRILKS